MAAIRLPPAAVRDSGVAQQRAVCEYLEQHEHMHNFDKNKAPFVSREELGLVAAYEYGAWLLPSQVRYLDRHLYLFHKLRDEMARLGGHQLLGNARLVADELLGTERYEDGLRRVYMCEDGLHLVHVWRLDNVRRWFVAMVARFEEGLDLTPLADLLDPPALAEKTADELGDAEKKKERKKKKALLQKAWQDADTLAPVALELLPFVCACPENMVPAPF